jgi:dipeptidyl-peptidase-4
MAPVADVRNYDTIYQERYVGLPDTDSAAYRDASAIHFVDGLRGDLLVVHGTGDDNVHYQGTEQLINALVAAGKPFTMMAYPNRSHGIFEGPGTTVHLYDLLTRYLGQHLPAGAR